MENYFILIELRDNLAVLQSEQGGPEICFLPQNLPAGVKEGDRLLFLISQDDVESVKRKQIAKDVLNEILT